jgi:AraC-like DNA-binding protein
MGPARCLFSAIEVFEKANEFYTGRGLPPYYTILIAGVPLQQKLQNASFSLNAIADIHTIKKPDCIILPASDFPNNFATRNSREALDWVVQQYKAGLDLRTDKVITDRDGVYTAGGASSGLNLILYLIEKYSGRPTALYCAKLLQIDIDRDSQSPFILFEGLKTHKDDTIREVQEYIEAKVEEKLTVEDLARHCAMHRINFTRRFKKATQITPIDYIQRVKIEAAKRSLESTRKNINEVMYSIGYADPKAFRNIFKKVAGVTPQEYKSKFAQHRSSPVS